jgi:hypothetical protein
MELTKEKDTAAPMEYESDDDVPLSVMAARRKLCVCEKTALPRLAVARVPAPPRFHERPSPSVILTEELPALAQFLKNLDICIEVTGRCWHTKDNLNCV